MSGGHRLWVIRPSRYRVPRPARPSLAGLSASPGSKGASQAMASQRAWSATSTHALGIVDAGRLWHAHGDRLWRQRILSASDVLPEGRDIARGTTTILRAGRP